MYCAASNISSKNSAMEWASPIFPNVHLKRCRSTCCQLNDWQIASCNCANEKCSGILIRRHIDVPFRLTFSWYILTEVLIYSNSVASQMHWTSRNECDFTRSTGAQQIKHVQHCRRYKIEMSFPNGTFWQSPGCKRWMSLMPDCSIKWW